MSFNLDKQIDEYLNLGKDTTPSIINHVESSKINATDFFNRLGKILEKSLNNTKKMLQILGLMDTVFENVPSENAACFIQTPLFSTIKTYSYNLYFTNTALNSQMKALILKWYDIFFHDENYTELFNLVSNINSFVDEKQVVEHCAKDIAKLKALYRQYEDKHSEELKEQILALGAKVLTEDNFEIVSNSTERADLLNDMFEAKQQIENLKFNKDQLDYEATLNKVKEYKAQLKADIEKLKRRTENAPAMF